MPTTKEIAWWWLDLYSVDPPYSVVNVGTAANRTDDRQRTAVRPPTPADGHSRRKSVATEQETSLVQEPGNTTTATTRHVTPTAPDNTTTATSHAAPTTPGNTTTARTRCGATTILLRLESSLRLTHLHVPLPAPTRVQRLPRWPQPRQPAVYSHGSTTTVN